MTLKLCHGVLHIVNSKHLCHVIHERLFSAQRGTIYPMTNREMGTSVQSKVLDGIQVACFKQEVASAHKAKLTVERTSCIHILGVRRFSLRIFVAHQ